MRIVTTTDELAALCAQLAEGPYVALDTEFMRDSTYWPKLCLIQAARPDMAAIIDPQAPGLDLAPFYALLADVSVTKVFHAARQDVEIFFHQGQVIPTPLYDTQVAAMVCGFGDAASYETLVRDMAHTQIDKSARFTDWARRPLTERQLNYALSDVTHLCKVYEVLTARIAKSGRQAWVEEELQLLRAPETYTLKPEDAWKRLKMRNGNRKFMGVMIEVAAWRERMAQARDVPRNRILKDDALYEVATQQPETAAEMEELRALPRGFGASRGGAELLEAVKTGLSLPASALPELDRTPPPTVAGPVADLLRVLLKLRCEEFGVAQKLVASSADIDLIAMDDNADVPAMHGWRQEIFGDPALALKRGRIAITMKGRRAVIVETAAAP
ncbi:MAG TPA: ribonuclease D [Alphaproteobacteria bacterium]|nr:ribonuclease D [Alphaproteobacteria bacterium]